ncbi:hypothetical protein PQG02_07655 [Nostoc sp. UHCC 0926]|uniref:hypothetical protein n=1 Tax=unclassified Nostoc TaxID=2593658 RepID=UPI0023620BC5|nr:hypothetical protein [Nostoc sp. UHCC 0926]WDD34203.1 hypothetical protein PQG02_07655 [Nostoc sp. UHCC 0926]
MGFTVVESLNCSKSGDPKHGDDRLVITQNFLLIENQMILARMFALSILNALGFGAIAFGNHEFDLQLFSGK